MKTSGVDPGVVIRFTDHPESARGHGTVTPKTLAVKSAA